MDDKKEKKKCGPKGPQIVLNLGLVKKLGQIQCTYSECAVILSTDQRTLTDDFLAHRKDFVNAYKKGAENGKMSLRRTQFTLAKKSPAMAIWLGKQYLGQRDNTEVVFPDANKYFKEIADAITRADTDTAGLLPGRASVCSQPGWPTG